MLLAAAVVTWMLFWMRRQAAGVRNELQAAVDRALSEGTAVGLAVLAFTAVIREGLETGAVPRRPGRLGRRRRAPSVLIGALVGLGIAVLLGVGFYRGASRVNLRTFFRWTGIALIFIAAGLLSNAVHEFVEIGWITIGTQTLFDASATLPHKAIDGAPGGIVLIAGQFLRALFGYTSQPEVITFVGLGDLSRDRAGPVPPAVQGRGGRDQAQSRHQLGVLRHGHRGSGQRPCLRDRPRRASSGSRPGRVRRRGRPRERRGGTFRRGRHRRVRDGAALRGAGVAEPTCGRRVSTCPPTGSTTAPGWSATGSP